MLEPSSPCSPSSLCLFATTSIGLSRAAEAQVLPRGVITLTSQDPWVHSSNIPIRLGLRVRSSIPAQDLLVNLALYTEPDQSALASRYEFDTDRRGPARWTEPALAHHLLPAFDHRGPRLGVHLRRRNRALRPSPGAGAFGQGVRAPLPAAIRRLRRRLPASGFPRRRLDRTAGHRRLLHDLPDRRPLDGRATGAPSLLLCRPRWGTRGTGSRRETDGLLRDHLPDRVHCSCGGKLAQCTTDRGRIRADAACSGPKSGPREAREHSGLRAPARWWTARSVPSIRLG